MSMRRLILCTVLSLLAAPPRAQEPTSLAELQQDAVESGQLRILGAPLRSHPSLVMTVDLSRDGKRCVSAGFDEVARVWDIDGSTTPVLLSGHDQMLGFAAFVGDGSRVITGSVDNTLRLWDAKTGAEQKSEDVGVAHNVAAVRPDGAWIASSANTLGKVEIRDTKTLEVVASVPFKGSHVAALAWSADGRYLAIGGMLDPKFALWDATEQKVVDERRPNAGVTSLAIRGDGKAIAFGGYDSIETYAFPELGDEPVHSVSGMDSSVRGLAWRDDTSLLFGDDDGAVNCVEVEGPSLVWGVHEHRDSVQSMAMANDRSFVVSGSHDGTIRFWACADGEERSAPAGNRDMVQAVAWSAKGDLLAAGDYGNVVVVHDASTGAVKTRQLAHVSSSIAVAIVAGNRAVSAGQDSSLAWIDPSSDDAPQRITLGEDDGPFLASGVFHGDLFVGGFGDGEVRVFNAGDGSAKGSFKAHDSPVADIACSADGKRIATFGAEGEIKVFEADGTLLSTPATDLEHDVELAFAGDLLAVGDEQGIVRIYTAATGELKHEIDARQDPEEDESIQEMCVSADGTRLATLTAGRIVVWNLGDNSIECAASAFVSVPTSGAFSPDGKRLATGMLDSTILVWDLAKLPRD